MKMGFYGNAVSIQLWHNKELLQKKKKEAVLDKILKMKTEPPPPLHCRMILPECNNILCEHNDYEWPGEHGEPQCENCELNTAIPTHY